jgi:hypothetical protein
LFEPTGYTPPEDCVGSNWSEENQESNPDEIALKDESNWPSILACCSRFGETRRLFVDAG